VSQTVLPGSVVRALVVPHERFGQLVHGQLRGIRPERGKGKVVLRPVPVPPLVAVRDILDVVLDFKINTRKLTVPVPSIRFTVSLRPCPVPKLTTRCPLDETKTPIR